MGHASEESRTVDLSGKVVVITGASAGVGASVARLCVAAGAKVVLAARGEAALQQFATELDAPDQVQTVACDVGSEAGRQLLLEQAQARFGVVDALVNNAGVNHRGAVDTVQAEQMAAVIELNLLSPMLLSRAVLPDMRERGRGAIVNVASLAGRVPVPDEASYSASKFGLRAFSHALAEECRGSGVSVSVVSPGPIATGFILNDPEKVPDLVFSQPMSSPEQVAQAIVDCLCDGKTERVVPASAAALTHLAYTAPAVFRRLRPVFERKGAKAKQPYVEAARSRS